MKCIPTTFSGRFGRGGECRDRDRARVRREDHVRLRESRKRAEDLLLEREPLGRRFDHHVVGLVRVELARGLDPLERRVGVGRGDLLLLHLAREVVRDRLAPALDGLRRDVREHDVVPDERRDVRDPAPHLSGTDHAERLDRHSHTSGPAV
jgi:hypothetical protein